MKRLTLILAIIVATLAVGLTERSVLAASIPSATAVVTVKDFQFTSTFSVTENAVGLEIDDKGDVLTGILFTGEIQKITPEGKASHFAQLPVVNPVPPPPICPLRPDPPPAAQVRTAFMTGFARHKNGDLYVGLPTCDPATNGIWRVSPDGSQTELFASLPVEDLPRGLALTNAEFPLYVTNLHDFRPEKTRANCKAALGTADPNDDCTLKVWRISSTGEVETWVESALFYGNPDSPLDHPHGVSGIVVDEAGQNVYTTVTDYGRVVRIPIENDGRAGNLEVVFETDLDKPAEQRELFGIDGIKIGPDGNFYIVSIRTDQLIGIRPGENTHTVIVAGHPLDGPTQLAFGKRRLSDGTRGKGTLPPLYIASGTGRRAFFLGVIVSLGQGSILSGVEQFVEMGIITEAEAIALQPRPSVVRVLLSTETTGGQ
jgi:hypothetical protein